MPACTVCFQKSWARYEEAYRVLRASQDRMGEVLVLASMAKSASESRSHYTGQCECQAIQLNKKCLDIARTLGCKVRKIHSSTCISAAWVSRLSACGCARLELNSHRPIPFLRRANKASADKVAMMFHSEGMTFKTQKLPKCCF